MRNYGRRIKTEEINIQNAEYFNSFAWSILKIILNKCSKFFTCFSEYESFQKYNSNLEFTRSLFIKWTHPVATIDNTIKVLHLTSERFFNAYYEKSLAYF